MGIYNLCDHRSTTEDTRVDAVFEVDCSDCESFGLPKHTESWTTWIGDTSIYDATMRAGGMRGRVTLYLYDKQVCSDYHPWLLQIHPNLPKKPFNPIEALAKKLISAY